MQTRSKRLLAWLLAAVMVLSMMPMTALADEAGNGGSYENGYTGENGGSYENGYAGENGGSYENGYADENDSAENESEYTNGENVYADEESDPLDVLYSVCNYVCECEYYCYYVCECVVSDFGAEIVADLVGLSGGGLIGDPTRLARPATAADGTLIFDIQTPLATAPTTPETEWGFRGPLQRFSNNDSVTVAATTVGDTAHRYVYTGVIPNNWSGVQIHFSQISGIAAGDSLRITGRVSSAATGWGMRLHRTDNAGAQLADVPINAFSITYTVQADDITAGVLVLFPNFNEASYPALNRDFIFSIDDLIVVRPAVGTQVTLPLTGWISTTGSFPRHTDWNAEVLTGTGLSGNNGLQLFHHGVWNNTESATWVEHDGSLSLRVEGDGTSDSFGIQVRPNAGVPANSLQAGDTLTVTGRAFGPAAPTGRNRAMVITQSFDWANYSNQVFFDHDVSADGQPFTLTLPIIAAHVGANGVEIRVHNNVADTYFYIDSITFHRPYTLIFNPPTVTINNENLLVSVAVGGTVPAGPVTITDPVPALPAGVTVVYDSTATMINVTGVRPTAAGAPPIIINGQSITATREGVSASFTLNVNLTTTARPWSAALASAYGTLVATSGTTAIDERVTLELQARAGYALTGITLGGTGVTAVDGSFNATARTIQFYMPAEEATVVGPTQLNVTVTPEWQRLERAWTATMTSGDDGELATNSTNGDAVPGTNVTLVLNDRSSGGPGAGFRPTGITVEGTGISGTGTFNQAARSVTFAMPFDAGMTTLNVTVASTWELIPADARTWNASVASPSVLTATTGQAAPDEPVTLALQARAGYHLTALSLTGVAASATNLNAGTISFVMPAGTDALDVTVNATWAATARTWNALVNGEGTLVAGTGSAAAGTDVTLTLNPRTGYTLTGLSISGATSNDVNLTARTITFAMPAWAADDLNVSVTPTWTPNERAWSASVSGTGALAANSTSGSATAGTTVTLTLNERSGYNLTGLTLSGTGIVPGTVNLTARTIQFNMPAYAAGTLYVSVTPTWTAADTVPPPVFPAPPSGTVQWRLSEDAYIQGLANNITTNLNGTPRLQQSGGATFTISANTAQPNSIIVGGRVEDWDGLDIVLPNMQAWSTYQVVVHGRSLVAPPDASIMIQGIDGHTWLHNAAIATYSTFTRSTDLPGNTDFTHLRVTTNADGRTMSFIIDEIFIVRTVEGTPPGGAPAEWQAVVDSPLTGTRNATLTATDDGILVTRLGSGQWDHNNGITFNLVGLRALSSNPDAVIRITGVLLGAGADPGTPTYGTGGRTMVLQAYGSTSVSAAIDETDGSFDMTVPATTLNNRPDWAENGVGFPMLGSPDLGNHGIAHGNYLITGIYIDGICIFELIDYYVPPPPANIVVTANATSRSPGRGRVNGFDWELWTQYPGGVTMTIRPDGSFDGVWTNTFNTLFRAGRFFGTTRRISDIGDITLRYTVAEFNSTGTAYLCVYGWTRATSQYAEIEWYVVDGWRNWINAGNNPPGTIHPAYQHRGTVTVNGRVYDIITGWRVNQPSIYSGPRTFLQIFSVRRDSQLTGGNIGPFTGTINLHEHFAAWEAIGLQYRYVSGTRFEARFTSDLFLHEVSFTIEGFGGSSGSSGTGRVAALCIVYGSDNVCTSPGGCVNCDVNAVAATGISVSPTTAALEVGATQTLTATVAPATATNRTVIWTSSNAAVATVSATGVVTAVGAGTATITATAADGGFTATTTVTVTGIGPPPPVLCPVCNNLLENCTCEQQQLPPVPPAPPIWGGGGGMPATQPSPPSRPAAPPAADAAAPGDADAVVIDADGASVTVPGDVMAGLGDDVDFSVTTTVTATGVTVNVAITSEGEAVNLSAPVTITVSMEGFDTTGLNTNQIVAVAPDGTIIFGEFDEELNVFIFDTDVPLGSFNILHMPNLIRLLVSIGSYVTYDLLNNVALVEMDVTPVIVDGRTLLPVRFLGYAFGATVGWNGETREVTLTLDGDSLTFAIGEAAPGMDVPAQIIDDRTMVPLRFIGEFFGATLTWDEATRSVEIVNY